MTEDIVIQRADEDSLADIAELEEKCFSVPWSYNAIEEFLKNEFSVCMIARYKEKTVGYIGMYKVSGQAEITNVAVFPEYRNNGIAGKLLESVIDFCKSERMTKIMLEVRESNSAAIHLYEKFGFYLVGKRKKYYKKPEEDALLFDLSLE